jgi:hypothetical protein
MTNLQSWQLSRARDRSDMRPLNGDLPRLKSHSFPYMRGELGPPLPITLSQGYVRMVNIEERLDLAVGIWIWLSDIQGLYGNRY